MADSWETYFRGTPEQRDDARTERIRVLQNLPNQPIDRVLKAVEDAQRHAQPDWPPYDPRTDRMRLLTEASALPPIDTEAKQDRAYVWENAVSPAYSAVFETAMRPRDTLIRATQEAAAGNGWEAAKLAARAPASIAYWPAAAGTPGSPDDWREDARNAGMSEAAVLALDIGTDPETYLLTPIPFLAAGRVARTLPRAMKAYGSAIRYGKGIPTHLVDEAGEVIRQLRSTPAGAR